MDSLVNSNFDYAITTRERIGCNYCGSNDHKILSRRDRYGFPVTTVICRTCGLIFINPRMTNEWYDKFYQNVYRELNFKYRGEENTKRDLEKDFDSARQLGLKLAVELKQYLNPGLIIEVGSSLGGILRGFQEVQPKLEILGIEPATVEANYAETRGIKTIIGLFENVNLNIPLADNLIIVRSLNHLLDPKRFFIWVYNQLKPNGKLIIMVINFLEACRRRNAFRTQIDHPFMFSPTTLRNFVEANGFEVVFEDVKEKPDYIKLVVKKSLRKPFAEIKIDASHYKEALGKLNPFFFFLNRWYRKLTSRF